jgi:hypothetical protein
MYLLWLLCGFLTTVVLSPLRGLGGQMGSIPHAYAWGYSLSPLRGWCLRQFRCLRLGGMLVSTGVFCRREGVACHAPTRVFNRALLRVVYYASL